MRQTGSFGIILTFCILISGWHSGVAASPSQEVQLFHRYSNLSSAQSDWSDWQLLWQKQQDTANKLYLEFNDIYHFGIHDQQLAIGKHIDSSPTLQYQSEITISNAHSLYPRYSLYGGIETKLNKALILNSSLRASHFDKSNSTATGLLFTNRVDYYAGNQLYSYTLYLTNMQGLSLSENVLSHNLKFAHIYSDRNNVYISYALGDEIDFDPDNVALSKSTIQTINMGGMHWLNQTLAIVYTIARHDVSFGYIRNELYFGIRKLY